MPSATFDDAKQAPLSRVVAEALVRRLTQPEVIERAKAEGLPEIVVETAVKVCGCDKAVAVTPAALN